MGACGNCYAINANNASGCYYVNGGRCNNNGGSCSSCTTCAATSFYGYGCTGCTYATCKITPMSTGAIIGVSIGCFFALVFLVALICMCCTSRYHYSNWGTGYGGGPSTMIITNQGAAYPPNQPMMPYYPQQQPPYPYEGGGYSQAPPGAYPGGYAPPPGGGHHPQGGYAPPQGGYAPPQGGYAPQGVQGAYATGYPSPQQDYQVEELTLPGQAPPQYPNIK